MIERIQALKFLAGNLSYFFDSVSLYLERDNDEEAAVLWAIITTLVKATQKTDIKISEDDICFLLGFMHVVWSTNKLVESGLMEYSDSLFDEYGFPAVTMNKEQYKAITNAATSHD